MDTNTNLDSEAAEQAYQESLRNLHAALNDAGTKAENLLSAVEGFTQELTTKLGNKAVQRPPKGFIEVTKRGTSNPVEKVLVAVHSIALIENFGWVENEPFSKLAVQLSRYAGVAYELDVLEPYDELKKLIAAAY